MTHHQTYSLSEPAGNLFLSTRFLGRGTSFPHRLMAAIAPILSETAYSDIRKELEDHDFIKRAAEPKCFAITRDGRDWLGYRKLNPDIWMGAMKGVQVTVEQSIADDDKPVVELMIIHAAALANSLYEQDKTFYIYFMGLSVQCQIHMGYLSEAQHKLEKLQRLAKEIKNDDLTRWTRALDSKKMKTDGRALHSRMKLGVFAYYLVETTDYKHLKLEFSKQIRLPAKRRRYKKGAS